MKQKEVLVGSFGGVGEEKHMIIRCLITLLKFKSLVVLGLSSHFKSNYF